MSTHKYSIDMTVRVHDHCLCGKYVIVYVQTKERARTNTYTHTDVYLHIYVVHFHVGTSGNSCVWGLEFHHVQTWRYFSTMHVSMKYILTYLYIHTFVLVCCISARSAAAIRPQILNHLHVLQHSTMHCNTAQFTATHCTPQPAGSSLQSHPCQHTATHCNTQCKASHSTTLADHLSMYVCVLCCVVYE